MLLAHVGVDWRGLTWSELRWLSRLLRMPDYHARWMHAWATQNDALYVLAVIAPLHIGFTAWRQRRRALAGDRTAAPFFWLAIGLFAGAMRCELHEFLRQATLVVGEVTRLAPAQMKVVMWCAAIGSPSRRTVSAASRGLARRLSVGRRGVPWVLHSASSAPGS